MKTMNSDGVMLIQVNLTEPEVQYLIRTVGDQPIKKRLKDGSQALELYNKLLGAL